MLECYWVNVMRFYPTPTYCCGCESYVNRLRKRKKPDLPYRDRSGYQLSEDRLLRSR
jgi:hypothetical protein